jgi:hypothetical protein
MIEQNVGHHYKQSYTNKTIRHEHSYKQPEVKTNRNNETDIIRNNPIKLLFNIYLKVYIIYISNHLNKTATTANYFLRTFNYE